MKTLVLLGWGLAGCVGTASDLYWGPDMAPTAEPPAKRPILSGIPADGLSLEQAVALAMSNNPRLATVRRELALASSQRLTARQYPHNPSVSIGADRTLPSYESGDLAVRFGISQEFEVGGQRSRRIGVAERNLQGVAAEIADAERLVRRDVTALFLENLMIDQLISLAERNTAVARKLRDVARARFTAKQIPEIEVDLVRLQYQRARNAHDRMVALRRATRLGLAALLGEPGRDEFLVRGELEMTPIVTERARAIDHALATRPDVAALKSRIQRERAEIELQRSLAIPNPEIGIFYTYDQLELGGVTDRDHLLGLEVSIPITVFNRRKGEIAEARARMRITQAAVHELHQQIAREIDLALNRLSIARDTVNLYETELNVLSQRNLATIETAYRAGEVGTLEVLRAQEDLIRVALAYQEALLEYNVARADLESALGGTMPEGEEAGP